MLNDVLAAITSLARPGQPVYLVGGAVRDRILGRDYHDLDFVMEGETRGLARQVADSLAGGFYVLDNERDTSRVVLNRPGESRLLLDFASLRGSDLETDLRARDFSINSLAMQLGVDDSLIDPCGGLEDLRQKRIRACGPTSLSDDPVRVLRGIRLAVRLSYRIEPETLILLRKAVPLLSQVSAERQRDELVRILEAKQSRLALRILDHVGALQLLIPECIPLKGLVQPEPHRVDGWEHTLEVLDHLESLLDVLAGDYKENTASGLILASAVLWLGRYREQFKRHLSEALPNDRSLVGLIKFAALYHDTGKAHTGVVTADGRLHFLGHEDVSEQLLSKRAHALAFSNQEIERAKLVVKGHMRVHFLADSKGGIAPRSVYRYFRALGDAGIDVCLLSLADLWATYSITLPQERWLAELQTCRKLLEARWEKTETVVRPVRLVSGHDLIKELNLEPGKIVGELLEVIREAQAAGEVTDRDEALTAAANWLNNKFGGSK